MLRNLLAGAAALSMVATPALASPVSASPAAKLSVAKNLPASARASAPAGKSKLRGGFLIPAVAVIAVILGIVLITGDDEPDSP